MLKTAPGQIVRRPHAAAPLPAAQLPAAQLHATRLRVSNAPAQHPLEVLAGHAANRLAGCTATLIAGCHAPAMLMVENCAAGQAQATATWLVTIASPTAMRLEAMVEESRLELLVEGPPDRILARLDNLARRAARTSGSAPRTART